MMWNYGYGYGPMMGWGTGLSMIFWWFFVIIGIILCVRLITGGHRKHWHMGEKTPLDILKERYAKGEIDKKEFEEKKKDLE
jgi:putative membrane protein